MKKETRQPKNTITRVIPLGGLCEVGKNSTIIETDETLTIIDAGMGFPFNEYPGVELVFPEIAYLLEKQKKIDSLILTHAHEDHIGGIIRLAGELNIPRIYGSGLTIALIEKRLADAKISNVPVLIKVTPKEQITVKNIKIRFIRITHSVPDCYSLIIETPHGKIIHTGDFKFDFTPYDNEHFDVQSLIEARNQGVKLLLSDSTNVERPGFTQSESSVGKNITKLFKNIENRIFITTFSSHIHRIEQIINASAQTGRKVCLLGYAMEVFAKIARDNGYLKYSNENILPLEEILKLPKNEIVIITSGSQGEVLSTLARMSRKEHKQLEIIPGDTVIFCANPIPGNERAVSKLQDKLSELGANLIYGRNHNIHVSGHACQEELKLMLALTRPEYFMPVHGDYRMLIQHSEIGASMGVDPKKIFILRNGDSLEVDQTGITPINKAINADPVYYDNMYGGITDDKTLKDRTSIGNEGIIVFIINPNNTDECKFNFIIKGITYKKGISEEYFIKEIESSVLSSIKRMKKAGTDSVSNIYSVSRDIITKISEENLHCKPQIIIYNGDNTP